VCALPGCGEPFYLTIGRIDRDGSNLEILDWYFGDLLAVSGNRALIWGGDTRDCENNRLEVGFASLEGSARFEPLKPQPKVHAGVGQRAVVAVIDSL